MNKGIFGTPGPSYTETWFYAMDDSPTTAASRGFQRWEKPRNATFIGMLGIGAGTGGGGGCSGTAGTARGGGGGGSPGGSVRAIYLASLLPDSLFISVTKGGPGGAAGNGGGQGGRSYVGVRPYTTTADLFLLTSQIEVTGASQGTPSAGGTGGAVATAVTTLYMPLAILSLSWTSTVGLVGITGGAQTGALGGDGSVLGITGPIGTGGSGAGVTTTDFAGGSIPAVGIVPLVAGGAGGGGNGTPGWNLERPLISTGGAGGGSNNSGTGGNGGDARIGSGGGGGGAGFTGGAGGKGGDGLVIIATW